MFSETKKANENVDINDVFHIYLSKILYESSTQIEDQCVDWGFDRQSVKILTYIQMKDLKKYPYSTQAAVIKDDRSNRMIIAFRGTEPMDLIQWLTDASTNFIQIKNIFDDTNTTNPIRVHAGFYSALGLSEFNPSQPIDFNRMTMNTPMFIQLIHSIEQFRQNKMNIQISITGHSLGGGLASLFTFVLLSYGYESSISGVYTYGQPLVGNRSYAQILHQKLGNRFHRWVNHSDIVTRIPVIELPSIAWYYARTPYSDALEEAANHNQRKSNPFYHHYYHSGLRFKIDSNGHLTKDYFIDQGPTLPYQDQLDLFHGMYSINRAIYSLLNITPIRAFLWLIAPAEINDHFPGDYARNIKQILRTQ